jgi:transcriptional regulator with XRE-family HTH domain
MKSFGEEKVAKAFGAFIREARESKGLMQADVAMQLGICRPYYCYIEQGARSIYFSRALQICKILGVSLDDFERRLE